MTHERKDCTPILILLDLVFGFATVFPSELGFFELPPALAEWNDYQANEYKFRPDWFMLYVISPLLIGFIVSVIGMFFFRRWGAILYILIGVILTFLTPLLGPQVEHGVVGAIGEFESLISGMIMGIVLFGGVFKKESKSTRPTETPNASENPNA